MASKQASKSRRQSISDLSPRERQAKGVRGGKYAVSTTETAVKASKLPTSGVSAARRLM